MREAVWREWPETRWVREAVGREGVGRLGLGEEGDESSAHTRSVGLKAAW